MFIDTIPHVVLRRRAFVVGLALGLSGCATADQRDPAEDEPSGDTGTRSDSKADADEPIEPPWLGDASDGATPSPHEPWPDVPDLVVLNHQQSSLTVWITVQGQPWTPPAFQETVSIRSRRPGGEPLGVPIEHVPVVGARSTVQFETSWGRRASYVWDGGSDRTGVRAHFYSDDISFTTVGE